METSAAVPAPLPTLRRRPLRRSEYERLAELGMFGDEKLELIEGELVQMSPQGALHASIIELLTELLVIGVASRARVRVQAPFGSSDISEPEPDLAVVARESHRSAHPESAFLVIEVSHSSLRADLQVKVPLYARSNVRELWIVDVEGQRVLVHTNAREGRWSHVQEFGRGTVVKPLAFPDVALQVSALFEE